MHMTDSTMLTTKQVAERLAVSTKRVWALIKAGRLPSQQFGRDHLINETDLALVADRKPGRPPKSKDEAETPVTEPAKLKGKRAAKLKDESATMPKAVKRARKAMAVPVEVKPKTAKKMKK